MAAGAVPAWHPSAGSGSGLLVRQAREARVAAAAVALHAEGAEAD